jgi:hypothetical protein
VVVGVTASISLYFSADFIAKSNINEAEAQVILVDLVRISAYGALI